MSNKSLKLNKEDKQLILFEKLQNNNYLNKIIDNNLNKQLKSKTDIYNKKINKINKTLPKKPGCYINVDKCPKQKNVKINNWVKDTYGESNLGSGNDSNTCLYKRKTDYNSWCGTKNTKTHFVPFKKPTSSGCYINVDKCSKKGIETNKWIRDTHGENNIKSGDDSNICLYQRKKDYNNLCKTNNTKTHFVKKNLFNSTFDKFKDLLGYPGICEGKTLKISTYPTCAVQCQKNPYCKAIIYDKKSKYCELLTNCHNKKKSKNWLYKEIKPLNEDKSDLFEFPKKFKFVNKKSPLFIDIICLLSILIFIILFSYDFIYSLYRIYIIYTEK